MTPTTEKMKNMELPAVTETPAVGVVWVLLRMKLLKLNPAGSSPYVLPR